MSERLLKAARAIVAILELDESDDAPAVRVFHAAYGDYMYGEIEPVVASLLLELRDAVEELEDEHLYDDDMGD